MVAVIDKILEKSVIESAVVSSSPSSKSSIISSEVIVVDDNNGGSLPVAEIDLVSAYLGCLRIDQYKL